MSESNDTLTATAPSEAARPAFAADGRPPLGSAMISQALCLTIMIVTTGVLVRLVLFPAPIEIHWALQIAMAAIAVSSSFFVAVHQWRYWTLSVRQMKRVIPEIRRGEAAIEELNRVSGGLRSLVPGIQEVFRDVRRLKAQISQMEAEMSQRVARRTDALERSLGSLRQQASRDALTGLYNRRMLDEMLPKVLNQCRMDGGRLCLLMIDVDDFKLLNDTLGHAAGDTLLRSLGQIIRSSLRETDLPFRYGGDELVIVLPGLTRKDGETLQTRLTSLMDGLTKPLHVARPPRLSIGLIALDEVATDFDGGPTALALMKLADEVLYNNKIVRKAARKAAEADGKRVA